MFVRALATLVLRHMDERNLVHINIDINFVVCRKRWMIQAIVRLIQHIYVKSDTSK